MVQQVLQQAGQALIPFTRDEAHAAFAKRAMDRQAAINKEISEVVILEKFGLQVNISDGKLMVFTAILAIILSCLGLFGLVSLNVAAKKKEFSIRKVLGAGTLDMAKGVNQQYIWILLVATIIGAPASYFVMGVFLDSVYKYHIPVEYISIAVGIIAIFAISFLTVSALVVKVIRENPVDALRTE